ncbi:MAG: phosphotransferase [Gemmatimonadetes bacterium]|nr:phosphotransferase [Gemmatimonadota bacterium]MBT5059534.1 phosphotransferase [Gemmatimonadota bacterium]MBT5144304.1 phosphotransferase [Gemmatimonadota bacterium]MBT5590030.1 phosphotransferase [Gemmatimonadota bacterium]MBT5964618.1 phosphotransferase [Gemmatimonadota bacterium]
MIPAFPDRLRRYAGGFEGGPAWLAELPSILEKCRTKWGLELGPATQEIKANYVGYAKMPDGQQVMLKVGIARHIHPEIRALQVYNGRGINQLIDSDLELSAMLIERFQPGTMLIELQDEPQRAQIAGRIMKQLHETTVAEPHEFPHKIEQLEKTIELIGDADLDRSRPYLDQLSRVQAMVLAMAFEPQILLHGDLHHYNILLDEQRDWTAIDPKGNVGPSCLDAGAFVGNARHDNATPEQERATILQAVTELSKTSGQSEERMLGGAFFDWLVWSARTMKDPPDDEEAHRLQMLTIYVELLDGIDLERLAEP